MADQKNVRWMIRRDRREVLDIERLSFEFPWSEEDFIRCQRQRNCIGMVYAAPARFREKHPSIFGFMVYELHKTRLHVLNFAVHPEYRRLGVGRCMAEKLLGKLSQQRRTRITLEVRERNLDAQLFFSEMGFKAVSVLRDYYDDSDEDAYLFQATVRDESEVAV